MIRYLARGIRRDKALEIAQLTKHQYYYRPKPGNRGRKPPGFALEIKEGTTTQVPDEQVVISITEILSDPDMPYGYHKMTKALQLSHLVINEKKVRRLMKETTC